MTSLKDIDPAAFEQYMRVKYSGAPDASPIQWHLFLISDGSGHPVLISAESESVEKAEELAIAGARESWDLDEEFLGGEYVGVIDRDVNKRF